jgi:hypothetical protein
VKSEQNVTGVLTIWQNTVEAEITRRETGAGE